MQQKRKQWQAAGKDAGNQITYSLLVVMVGTPVKIKSTLSERAWQFLGRKMHHIFSIYPSNCTWTFSAEKWKCQHKSLYSLFIRAPRPEVVHMALRDVHITGQQHGRTTWVIMLTQRSSLESLHTVDYVYRNFWNDVLINGQLSSSCCRLRTELTIRIQRYGAQSYCLHLQ